MDHQCVNTSLAPTLADLSVQEPDMSLEEPTKCQHEGCHEGQDVSKPHFDIEVLDSNLEFQMLAKFWGHINLIDWEGLKVSQDDPEYCPGFQWGYNLVQVTMDAYFNAPISMEDISGIVTSMILDVQIDKRVTADFTVGTVLKGRWKILSRMSKQDAVGSFNKGINVVEDMSKKERDPSRLCIQKLLDPVIRSQESKREIEIVRRLKHPNITGYRDSYLPTRADHIPWLCMEYCQHGTLQQLVELYAGTDFPIPETFLWHVFASLAYAIQYCHFGPDPHGAEAGSWDMVVHRDIILGNVFLAEPSNAECGSMNHTCRYPVIKLGDFGCAAPHSEVKSGALAQFPCDAECKARFKGAAHLPEIDDRYTPPEGAGVDPSGDVYQIGLVMLCLFSKKNDPQDALATASGSPPEWASIYTPKLVGLIATCIQADIANRATSDSLGDEITAHLTQALEYGELTVQDKIMTKSR